MIFSNANMSQLAVAINILKEFCDSSRQMVNRDKSVLVCLNSVPDKEVQLLVSCVDFLLEIDLGRYLGLIIHDQNKKNTY